MKRLLMACIMMLSITTASYSADEIIFRVPVELVSLHPNVNSVRVRCNLYSEPDGRGMAIGGQSVVLHIGDRDVQNDDMFGQYSIKKGPSGVTDFAGIIIVRPQIAENHSIDDAKSYKCFLQLGGPPVRPGRAVLIPQLQNEAPEDFPVWAQADPNRPFVNIVRGNIP